MNLLNDIYYQREYIKLYLKDDDEIFEFKYEEDGKFFYNIALKKSIKTIKGVQVDEQYFDIETAYGYGGIYSNSNDSQFLEVAFKAYQEYCKQEKIIADFSRIHPFNTTSDAFKNKFQLHVKDRNTVIVDTSFDKETRWSNYSAKVRNILRKCNKELQIRKSENLNQFIELYEKTMQKNNADDFYFFDKSYFEQLISLPNVELYEVLFNERVISASFVMFGDELAHYHLSANDYEYRKHNANYFILDSLFDVAHSKNKKFFHLGGGRTNEEEDTLLKFKKKFSSLTKDFFIGGIVHNNEIYDKYCLMWKEKAEDDIRFFLKYRLQ